MSTAQASAVQALRPHVAGLTLRDSVPPALGLSVTQAAQQLGVSRDSEARLWLAGQSASDKWWAAQKFKAAPMRAQRAPVVA